MFIKKRVIYKINKSNYIITTITPATLAIATLVILTPNYEVLTN
jgi:hypothetical protein